MAERKIITQWIGGIHVTQASGSFAREPEVGRRTTYPPQVTHDALDMPIDRQKQLMGRRRTPAAKVHTVIGTNQPTQHQMPSLRGTTLSRAWREISKPSRLTLSMPSKKRDVGCERRNEVFVFGRPASEKG